jgi:hypothetical protein
MFGPPEDRTHLLCLGLLVGVKMLLRQKLLFRFLLQAGGAFFSYVHSTMSQCPGVEVRSLFTI